MAQTTVKDVMTILVLFLLALLGPREPEILLDTLRLRIKQLDEVGRIL
jgi:hypothetical protein